MTGPTADGAITAIRAMEQSVARRVVRAGVEADRTIAEARRRAVEVVADAERAAARDAAAAHRTGIVAAERRAAEVRSRGERDAARVHTLAAAGLEDAVAAALAFLLPHGEG